MSSADHGYARLAALLVGGVAAFQFALAAGAPWGRAAWGGQNPGVLPPRLRRSSAASGVALAGLAGLLASGSGLSPGARHRLTLAAAGYFTLGTAMNAASRSPVERAIWAPTSALTAGLLWASAKGR